MALNLLCFLKKLIYQFLQGKIMILYLSLSKQKLIGTPFILAQWRLHWCQLILAYSLLMFHCFRVAPYWSCGPVSCFSPHRSNSKWQYTYGNTREKIRLPELRLTVLYFPNTLFRQYQLQSFSVGLIHWYMINTLRKDRF